MAVGVFKQLARYTIAVACLAVSSLPAFAAAPDWRAIYREVEFDPKRVADDAVQALRRAEQAADVSAQLAAWRLYVVASDTYDITIAPAELQRGEGLARRAGDSETLCAMLLHGATAALYKGDVKASARLQQEASGIAERNGDKHCLAFGLYDMGHAANHAGRVSDGLALMGQAYERFATDGDSYGMALALNSLANFIATSADEDADQLGQAIGYYERAAGLIDLDVYRYLGAIVTMNLGITQHRLKQFAKARSNLEASLDLARKLGYEMFEPVVRYRLAALALDEGRYHESLAMLDEHAMERLGRRITKKFLFEALLIRADALAHVGDRKASLAALAKAQTLAPSFNTVVTEVAYFQRSARVHALLGDTALAYEHLNAAREADKKAARIAKARLADELRIRFDAQLKDKDNELLRAQEQQANARWLAITLGLALAIVALGSAAYFLRRRVVAARREVLHQSALAETAAAASHAKGTFLANMSHELRSPLNAMLGFTRLLLRDPALESRREDLAIVLRSGEHLYTLINQVLEMSKIEAGRVNLVETEFDLHALLEELREMFSVQARGKGVRLEVKCEESVPQHVRADAVKLRQVLVNLMSNALKFTAHGEVKLRAATEPDGRLAFAVTDTGVGIAEDELALLGQAFMQARAGQHAAEGTGLGLAISRSFVQLMGGELTLSSRAGQGTHACFAIPVQAVDFRQAVVAPAVARQRVRGLAAGTPAQRILVVDDRDEGRLLLMRLLVPLGFEVREAADGEQAIAAWQQWRPQLILMDMRMPVLDGREATRRIKATEQGLETVVVALTASSFEEQRADILAAGCDDFIRKPFQEEVLLEMLARHLKVEYTYETPAPTAAPAPPAELTAMHLAQLPDNLRSALRTALEQLDVTAIERALEAVRRHDATCAAALAPLLKRFQYERVRALIP